jgi:anaerobic magnesium-protoporphyrin IX monomethyl ester cyclase
MKVLLTTLNAKYIHINLAIRLLYELNIEKHPGLVWKEFTIREDRKNIASQCAEYQIIAFSCYIWNITQTLEVCREIKAINPNIKILLGGPEVSYDWQDIIILDEVDYIISGEGEIPFAKFLDNYPNDLMNVPNLVSKKDGSVHFNPLSETFELSGYTDILPYQHDTAEELRNKVAYIETSRGCPYKCEFCLASLDNKVRYLPNKHIKDNLLYLMQNGKVIKFLDRTFNMKRDFTIDIFQFILDNHLPGNVFQFEITADILHPDIITFINEHVPVGLFRFEIGIQTVNQAANLNVSRKQNFEKTKAIIRAVEDKIELHLDLIVGLALDYWEDIKYSFEETFKLFPPELQLGFLKFLKGTPVRYKIEEHDFVYDPNPPYQIISSKYLSATQLEDIEIMENALEIYWNKNRARNTMQYVSANYSSFEFLMALGKHFVQFTPFHKYKLTDVYEYMYTFVDKAYPEDSILKELITIDYYIFHNVKPKTLFVPELTKKDKYELLNTMKLNHNIFRFVVIPISFDYLHFKETNTIKKQESIVFIQYNGTDKAFVVHQCAGEIVSIS